MNLNLPKPASAYDYQNEVETRRQLETAIADALSKSETITLQPGQRVVLTSAGGVKWALSVDDAGALSTTAA